MHLPTPQPVSTSHYCVIGDVSIHPHAKIAPGVILQAAPQSRIEVAAGVCIGMGTVIQAYQGTVIIDINTTIGAGVLVMGTAHIAANACIGDSTTIINTNIAALQVVPAGSLMGDQSRPTPDASHELSPSQTPFIEENKFGQNLQNYNSVGSGSDFSEAKPSHQSSAVIGRAYVTQMLHVMFARTSS